MSVQQLVKVKYPTSDGKPMAETPLHRDEMIYLIEALQELFQNDPQVYVTGNMLLYYEEGNWRRSLSPDVMVTKGISKRQRDIYLVWGEGKGPDVVIEVTSKRTKRTDQGKKKELYEQVLQVKEYYLYDPLQEYVKEGMQGYRLVGGRYEAIAPVEPGRFWSEELGVELRLEGKRIRVYDPVAGRGMLRREELAKAQRAAQERAAEAQERAAEAERRAAQEAEARRQLEAELERLKAELERRRSTDYPAPDNT